MENEVMVGSRVVSKKTSCLQAATRIRLAISRLFIFIFQRVDDWVVQI